MIEDEDCKCKCGFNTEPYVHVIGVCAGEYFNCPSCGQKLQLHMGDNYDEASGECEDYYYVSDLRALANTGEK